MVGLTKGKGGANDISKIGIVNRERSGRQGYFYKKSPFLTASVLLTISIIVHDRVYRWRANLAKRYFKLFSLLNLKRPEKEGDHVNVRTAFAHSCQGTIAFWFNR